LTTETVLRAPATVIERPPHACIAIDPAAPNWIATDERGLQILGFLDGRTPLRDVCARHDGWEEAMNLSTGLLVALATSVAVVTIAAAQGSLEDDLHIVVPRDAIPAINKPEFEPVERADRYMNDRELVIGLVSEKEQRAYSTWQLDRHEIVNDTFEGRPVAVTW